MDARCACVVGAHGVVSLTMVFCSLHSGRANGKRVVSAHSRAGRTRKTATMMMIGNNILAEPVACMVVVVPSLSLLFCLGPLDRRYCGLARGAGLKFLLSSLSL